MPLLFGKYTFTCTLSSEAFLPRFKGSTFRGVFGRALKQTVCALKYQECNNCLLKEKCLYCVTFETHILDSKENAKQPNRPHPFVINPPLSTQTHFPEGSRFEFELLLFGPLNDSLPYFIYAFDHMGNIGMGKKINGNRGTFHVDHVRQNSTIIYSTDNGQLKPVPPDLLDITVSETSPNSEDTMTVTLLTPLRVKFKNQLQDQLPFHVLIRTMLRRASSLFDWYGSQIPEFNYKDLIEKAGKIKSIKSNIRWIDWKRYSFRQKDSMLMGGMTGSITYQGDLGEFLPLMAFCEQVNIGKQTVFGLGKLESEMMKTMKAN